MRYIVGFGKFWYHFIVGDDYRIAIGVMVGLSICALFVHVEHEQVWWLLPILVIAMLGLSLQMEVRRKK